MRARARRPGPRSPVDRWERILSDPCDRPGRWVVLPENAWGAVMAFAAGPGRTRPHDVPRDHRTVTVVTTTDGVARSHAEPMSVDDLATIAAFIDAVLAEAGIGPSPRTWWEVELPAGVTEDAVDRAVAAAEREGDLSGLDGAARTRREADVLRETVEGWFRDLPGG